MKILLSLRRLKGQRLAADKGDIRQRLVDFRLARADGYRVARAQCCVGGSELAVLWEPTLVRVDGDSLLFQGFEKAGEQTVVQEWIASNPTSQEQGHDQHRTDHKTSEVRR